MEFVCENALLGGLGTSRIFEHLLWLQYNQYSVYGDPKLFEYELGISYQILYWRNVVVVEVQQLKNRENRIFWYGFGFHQDFCIGTVLSAATEEAIVKWILTLDDWGFPPRLDCLWEKVNVLAKAEKEARQPTGKEARDWYMITSDKTGLYSFSIGTLNSHHNMLDESITNECTPTIHCQSKIISENLLP